VQLLTDIAQGSSDGQREGSKIQYKSLDLTVKIQPHSSLTALLSFRIIIFIFKPQSDTLLKAGVQTYLNPGFDTSTNLVELHSWHRRETFQIL